MSDKHLHKFTAEQSRIVLSCILHTESVGCYSIGSSLAKDRLIVKSVKNSLKLNQQSLKRRRACRIKKSINLFLNKLGSGSQRLINFTLLLRCQSVQNRKDA